MLRTRELALAVVACGVALLLPAASLASPIVGTLNVGGSTASVGATFINFTCNPTITATCPANYGNFIATSPTDGSFAPYATDSGFVHNVSSAGQPINQTFLLSNFLVFNPAGTVVPPDIALDLTFVFTGTQGQASCTAAPTVGQNCTPVLPALVTAANPSGLSPFNLQNTQTGSSASFSVAGIARRISTGEQTAFSGLFTAQFTVPYQSYLPTIAAGGSVSDAYSATFTATPIPEPATFFLIGAALIGLVKVRRSR